RRHARPRHRRQHRDLQRRERRCPAPAAVRRSRPAVRHLERARSVARRSQSGVVSRHSRLADAELCFHAPRRLRLHRFEITGPEGVDYVRAVIGMPSVYSVRGATPLIGRLPGAGDARAPVVAISYRLWQRRYGGDRGIVGRTAIADEKPFTIVGVMRAGFHFPTPDIDLWMSLQPIASQAAPNPWITSLGLRGWRV